MDGVLVLPEPRELYRLLCSLEEVKREEALLARKTAAMVSDESLRSTALLVEAWSELVAGLAVLLRNYVDTLQARYGATGHTRGEDAGLLVRLASEYLGRRDSVKALLRELLDAIGDENVRRLLEAVVEGERSIEETLARMREQLEKELAVEKPRPEHNHH